MGVPQRSNIQAPPQLVDALRAVKQWSQPARPQERAHDFSAEFQWDSGSSTIPLVAPQAAPLVELPESGKLIGCRIYVAGTMAQMILPTTALFEVLYGEFETLPALTPIHATADQPILFQNTKANVDITNWNKFFRRGDIMYCNLMSFVSVVGGATPSKLTFSLLFKKRLVRRVVVEDSAGDPLTTSDGEPVTFGE